MLTKDPRSKVSGGSRSFCASELGTQGPLLSKPHNPVLNILATKSTLSEAELSPLWLLDELSDY
jgi:hypothetical protein